MFQSIFGADTNPSEHSLAADVSSPQTFCVSVQNRAGSRGPYVTLFCCCCCLCVCSTAQSDSDTDEVVPRLLSGPDAHLSSDHTARKLRRRGQRSLEPSRAGDPDPTHLVLSLPAFGRNLYLNLTRDSSFLARDVVVEGRRGDRSAGVTHISTDQLCFYSGSVINHTDSLASLSTCGGLVNPSGTYYVS